MADDRAGIHAGDAHDTLAKPSYDLKAMHRNQALLEDFRSTLTHLGFALQQIDHEDATGQRGHVIAEAARNSLRQRLFKLRRLGPAPLLRDGGTLALAEGVNTLHKGVPVGGPVGVVVFYAGASGMEVSLAADDPRCREQPPGS